MEEFPPSPTAAPLEVIPARMLANTIALLKTPKDYFSRLEPNPGFAGALACYVLVNIAQQLLELMILPSPARVSLLSHAIFLLLFSIPVSLLSASVFHAVCRLLGGQGSWKASYAVFASIAPLSLAHSFFKVFGITGWIAAPYILFLLSRAGSGVHRLEGRRAWLVPVGLIIAAVLMSVSARIIEVPAGR